MESRRREFKNVEGKLETIGAAIGRIPSGCSILTVAHAGRSTGMLVSWVQQVAFDPPSVSVGVKQGRPATALLEGSRRFVLNLVGEDPKPMFRRFAKGFTLEEDAFAGLAIEPSEFGPIIPECIAHLGCRITQRISIGDHDLYIAEVSAARAQTGARPYVHLRSSGLSY